MSDCRIILEISRHYDNINKVYVDRILIRSLTGTGKPAAASCLGVLPAICLDACTGIGLALFYYSLLRYKPLWHQEHIVEQIKREARDRLAPLRARYDFAR